MTINSTTRKAGPFIGNGGTTVFPFAFKVFTASDLLVVKLTVSTGSESTLVLNSDYTVTLNLDQDSNPGGSITLLAGALATGYNLILTSDIADLQPTDLTNQGGFYPDVINDALDRATIQIQQLQEETDRSLKYPISDAALGTTLPSAAQRAGVVLAFDENAEPVAGPTVAAVGTVLSNIANINTVATNIVDVNTVADNIADVNTVAGDIANVNAVANDLANIDLVAGDLANIDIVATNVVDVNNFADVYQGAKTTDPTLRNDGSALHAGDMYFNTSVNELRIYSGTVWVAGTAGTMAVQRFSGTGSDTAFTLATAPAGENNTQVYINGVYQQKDTYGVTGVTLTFSAAPPAGTDNIEVVTISTLALGQTTASLVSITDSGNYYSSGTVEGALQEAAQSSTTRFTQTGTNAVTRSVQSKLTDMVSAFDFMTTAQIADVVGLAGAIDVTAALQAAIDTGKDVFMPKGLYKTSAPLTLSTTGQKLIGENPTATYIVGQAHDLVRIGATHIEVAGILFRPAQYSDTAPAAFACIRVYSGIANIHHNRFLSASSGHGTAILLDDVNPATSAIIAGAYTHTINNNWIGASGYSFKYGIFAFNANNGQQATKFINNMFLGDSAIYVYYGGGNYYSGNLFQSATGVYGSGVGNAIDLQSSVTSETITGNYIERYQFGVIMRRSTQDYIQANIFGNAWDNNTTNIYSLSSPLYAYYDELSSYDYKNGWQWRYGNQDNLKLMNREGIEIVNFNRASYSLEPRVLGHNLMQSLSYSGGNGTTQTPTASWCEITGGGAARTGCFLGNGTRQGQHLYLRGQTWSVQIMNNPGGTQNIVFAGNAASATFGQTGNVGQMHLIWDSAYGTGRWFEISRTLA